MKQQYYDIKNWVKSQWLNSNLGDLRRNTRTIRLAINLLERPEESLPCQLEEWKDLKAAYRLLNSKSVSHKKFQEKHWQNTINEAINGNKVVLYIQDTSELDYSSKKATTGIGPIGNHRGQGIMIHTVLAVEYHKTAPNVLGLAFQHAWIRDNVSRRKTETKKQRRERPTEADLWRDSLMNIEIPQDTDALWVSVGDRGNDIFEFIKFCKDSNWDYLVRANYNRKIITQSGQAAKLFDYTRALPSKTTKEIEMRSRDNKPARKVLLNIAWVKIKISTPKNLTRKSEYEQIEAWCIRCWEDASDGLEWFLLTNLAITSKKEALEKIGWYETRWLIEEYHKCLKTGCAIEKRQLQSAQGLLSLLGLLGVIATKLLEMKFLARQHPNDLAIEHIPKYSLQIICSRFKLSLEKITCRQFWHKVAAMGGFIGRRSDGDPGWQTLWKGWLRLLDMLMGAEVIQRCG
jgi:hypothetical protein